MNFHDIPKGDAFYEICNEHLARCAKCGNHCGIDYDYADDTGWSYSSICCGSHMIDVSDGSVWEPDYPAYHRKRNVTKTP